LLSEGNVVNGELTAENYPTELEIGDEAPLVLTVTNHEGESVTYSVVIQLQGLSQQETPTVVRREQLLTARNVVSDGETWQYDHTLAPTFTGNRLRAVYLIYRGEPPDQPTVDNSYRHLSLSIDVE
jgi:uncharacterized membrane protein